MPESKQSTAVEWLLENLISEPHSEEDFKYNSECWDKAKQMEKENTKRDVYELCKLILSNPIETSGKTPTELFEQYYSETYGKDSTE